MIKFQCKNEEKIEFLELKYKLLPNWSELIYGSIGYYIYIYIYMKYELYPHENYELLWLWLPLLLLTTMKSTKKKKLYIHTPYSSIIMIIADITESKIAIIIISYIYMREEKN